MKSMKQQMTTAVSLMLVIIAVAACAPEQAFAKDKGRVRANHNGDNQGDYIYKNRFAGVRRQNNFVLGEGSVRHRNNASRRYSIGGVESRPTESLSLNFEEFRHNNLTVNAGRRRNLIGSPEYFIRVDTPNMRDSSAKARGKQGH